MLSNRLKASLALMYTPFRFAILLTQLNFSLRWLRVAYITAAPQQSQGLLNMTRTTAWLAQLVGYQTVVRDCRGFEPLSGIHSGS